MIRIIINKIKSTQQHKDPAPPDPEAALGVVEVPETFVDEPVSLKFLAKFGAVNLFPQFPQNSSTSLFS